MGGDTDVMFVHAAARALACLPWQSLGRRLGLPYRAPGATEAVVGVGLSMAAAMALSALGLVGARRTARTARGTAGGATVSWRSALGWLPVFGPILAASDEIRFAGASPRLSARLATIVILAVSRVLTYRLLDRVLRDGAASTPAPPAPQTRLNLDPPVETDPVGFVVYLDGVGRVVRRTTPTGQAFALALRERLAGWTIVMSMMPNDVTQHPAWRRPATGPLWRRLSRRSRSWLIGRGVWEGVVVLDRRYRDRVMADHTATIITHVQAAGYRAGSGVPVLLVGLSAGAQVALHCASDVARALIAPTDVVCLGGFADGAADLSAVRRVHAVVSWGDPAELAPVGFLPSRWVALGVGPWSRAARSRRVVRYRHDYATHIGHTGYLGDALAPDGRTRRAQSADVVALAARELVDHVERGAHADRTGRP